MSGSQSKRNHRREARTRAEVPKNFYARASPKRVGRAFALLTRTYHGGRLLGSWPNRNGDSLTLKLTEAYSRATAPCRVLSWCPLSQEGKGRTQGRQGCRTRCGSRSLGMLLAFC